MWYKNIAGRFFGLVTKHACDRRTDGRTDRRTDVVEIEIEIEMSNYSDDSFTFRLPMAYWFVGEKYF